MRSACTSRQVRWPWLLGVVAFFVGLGWEVLVVITAAKPGGLPAIVPVAVAAAVALGAIALLRRWTASARWWDAHPLGLITGRSSA